MAELEQFWRLGTAKLRHEQGMLHVSKMELKNCTIRKGQWDPNKPVLPHEFYGSYGYGNQLRLGQLVNNALLLPLHVSKEGGLTWFAVYCFAVRSGLGHLFEGSRKEAACMKRR